MLLYKEVSSLWQNKNPQLVKNLLRVSVDSTNALILPYMWSMPSTYTLFKPFCCNGPLYVFTLFLQTLIQYELRYDL